MINVHHVREPDRILCQGCAKSRPAIVKVTRDGLMVCKTCAKRASNKPELIDQAWKEAAKTKVRPRPVNPPKGWYRTDLGIDCHAARGRLYTIRRAENEREFEASSTRQRFKFEPVGVFATIADAKKHIESLIALDDVPPPPRH